jgi:hypothetical protein
MARIRRSPYLPGVRSRLWRFVRRGFRDDTAQAAADVAGPVEGTDATEAQTERTAPMLALIRRLPLDDPS